jgi:hypothetical protein
MYWTWIEAWCHFVFFGVRTLHECVSKGLNFSGSDPAGDQELMHLQAAAGWRRCASMRLHSQRVEPVMRLTAKGMRCVPTPCKDNQLECQL